MAWNTLWEMYRNSVLLLLLRVYDRLILFWMFQQWTRTATTTVTGTASAGMVSAIVSQATRAMTAHKVSPLSRYSTLAVCLF